MVAVDITAGASPCPQLCDALPRLAHALGLPSDAAARVRSRIAALAPRTTALVVGFDPRGVEIHVPSEAHALADVAAILQGSAPHDGAALAALLSTVEPDANGLTSAAIVSCVWPPEAARTELHLDLRRQGLRASKLAEATLHRWGFTRAWSRMLDATSCGPLVDQCVGIRVQVVGGEPGGAEVCFLRHDLTTEALATVARAIPGIDPHRVTRAFHGLVEGTPCGVPVATSVQFDAAGELLGLRIGIGMRAVARQDGDVCARLAAARERVPTAEDPRLLDVIGAAASAPIDARRVVDVVESQWSRAGERMFVRLEFELGAPERLVGSDGWQAATWADHPFFARAARDGKDPARPWLVLRTLYVAVSQHAARRWAGLVARIDDDRSRSILAWRLATELGNGECERACARRLRRLLDAEGHGTGTATQAGVRLSSRLDALFGDEHPYVGVGAAIGAVRLTTEILGFVAKELADGGHAVAAAEVASSIGDDGLERLVSSIEHEVDRRAAARGERAVLAAGWTALDDLYRDCLTR